MDLCMQSELSKNPVQNMHTHYIDKKASLMRNAKNRQSLMKQITNEQINLYEDDAVKSKMALKSLIETANSQLNIMVNGPTFKRDYPTVVRVYIVFLKVGEIDNVKERFQADAYIEAMWEDSTVEGKTYDPKGFWNPELYIENSLGNLKQDIKYKVVNKDNKTFVYEMRSIKGSFWEKLELGEFPLGNKIILFDNIFNI